MGNIESVDGQSEMKHHIMPLKVPMPDPTELEEKFAIVLVSWWSNQKSTNFINLVYNKLIWLSNEKVRINIPNNGVFVSLLFALVTIKWMCLVHYELLIFLNEPTCAAVPPLILPAVPLLSSSLLSSPAVLLSPLKSDNSANWAQHGESGEEEEDEVEGWIFLPCNEGHFTVNPWQSAHRGIWFI